VRRAFVALAAVVVGLLLLAPGARPAAASDEWCESDPAVAVRTPAGAVVVVYVTNGALGAEHRPALARAQIGYAAVAAPGGAGTLVDMEVVVPDDGGARFPTRSVVSTRPLKTGAVLAAAEGWSGRPLRLRFQLGVP
jgi:hypothetical protein